MNDDHGSWKPMDPNLKDAACNGNTKFLKNAKPQDYWLSRFIPTTNSKEPYAGNILHLAVWHGKTDFLKTAMEKLPEEVVRQLLRHRERAGELHNWTPALLAIHKDDWLSAEMLTSGSRAKLIQDLVDDQDNSPLFLAVQKGFDNVVMNILDCQGALCARGPNGLTALHAVLGLLHYKSASWYDFGRRYDKRWRQVSEKLFERLRELATGTDTNGFTILHKWVEAYSLSGRSTKNRIAQIFADFFQRFQGDAVKLMLATDHKDCNNVLHHTAIFPSTDSVAKQLIESYKNCASKPSDLLQPWLMKNKDEDTPLILAIRNKRDKLAVLFLSADPVGSLRLSDRQNPFIFAVCNRCNEVAKEILAKVAEHDFMSLLPFDDNPRPDVLHFALCFPETFVKEVKEKLPFSPEHDMKLGSSAEYRVCNWESWKPMDVELKKAAWSGDVGFLRDKIASEPWTYWLSRYIPPEDGVSCAGNILHLALWRGKTEFVKQAMEKLPGEVVNLLLCQQETAGKNVNSNPLHLALSMEHHPIVKAIADRDDHLRMSLPEVAYKYTAKDSKGRTPALLAIQNGDSCCADILTSNHRAELIQDIVDNEGNSPLFLAVQNGLPKVVSNLLDCVDLCGSGPDGSTALHVAPGLPASSTNVDDIYQKLLRLPNLITKSDNNGFTVLHNWAEMGCKPATDKCNFESLLNMFFKNHGDDAIKLMLATDSKVANNPLHVLVATSASTCAFSEHMAVKIATQLVDLFEKYMAPQTHHRIMIGHG